jgi:hypothetical protein
MVKMQIRKEVWKVVIDSYLRDHRVNNQCKANSIYSKIKAMITSKIQIQYVTMNSSNIYSI